MLKDKKTKKNRLNFFKKIKRYIKFNLINLTLTDEKPVWLCSSTCFSPNFNFFLAKIECGLYFLDRFDVLMSKIIFKK